MCLDCVSCKTKITCVYSFCPYKGPSPCRGSKYFDIGVVVDSSSSISYLHFRLVRMFLETFVAQFDIGRYQTHIGMLVYSFIPMMSHSLTNFQYQNLMAQTKKARELRYIGGYTRTDRALEMANNKFFTTAAQRENIPKVCVVLTDGKTGPGSKPYASVLAPLKMSSVLLLLSNTRFSINYLSS